MAQNARIGDEWIQSAERIQIASAEAYESHLEQHIRVCEHRISDGLQISLARFAKHKRSHVCTWGQVIGKVIDVNNRSSRPGTGFHGKALSGHMTTLPGRSEPQK